VSGETEEQVSGWTVDTLRTETHGLLHEADRRYEQRFEGQEKAVSAALQAAKEAVAKAETAAEKRFDAVNEFRGQLSDQAATFMPRREAEQVIAALAEKVSDLASRVDTREGRGAGLNAGWGYLIAAVGLAATVIAIVYALAQSQ
jgi:hypothetical protein